MYGIGNMIPLHATLSIGQSLAPDYFSPGYSVMHGKKVSSLWAIAFWQNAAIRYEREDIGAPWIRIT